MAGLFGFWKEMDMPRPFEGELVRLRAREESDTDDCYRWINDWETLRYLGARYPRSRAAEKRWLNLADPSFAEATFIVETLAEKKAIGFVGLGRHGPEDRAATLVIAIGEHDYLDGGYGTDTMRTVCRVGFEVMNLNRVDLTVYTWNPRATRVYEKVGFRHEGVLREAIFRMGRWNDLVFMGLLRGELR